MTETSPATSTPPPPARDGVPLKDRPRGPEDRSAPAAGPRRRHCWVDLTGHPHLQHQGETEGLILQWAQDDGWVALVAYVYPRPGGDMTIQEWIPAHRLRPATS